MTDINISVSMVKTLRDRTGAGMMECKKALIESSGNISLAIDNMRKSGKTKADRKILNLTTEGIILAKISKNKKYGVIVEINSETDFLARDSMFQKFGNDVIETALNEHISDVHSIRVKFEEERIALVTKIGENINIRRLGVLEGNVLGCYLHGCKTHRIGVIVSAYNAEDILLKHIAMHIAASNPEYVNPSDVPYNIIDREYNIQLNIAMQLNKPKEIAKKIVEGRMLKFTKEVSLTGQSFIMDSSKTVGDILIENNSKIKDFIRFELGEEINHDMININRQI